MSPPNSSISNSEPPSNRRAIAPGAAAAPPPLPPPYVERDVEPGPGAPRRSTLRGCALVLLWTMLFLVLGDVAINNLFAMPASPTQESNGLQQFFDYGRSVESKLRRMIGPDEATTHPLLRAGWIDKSVGAAGEKDWNDPVVAGARVRVRVRVAAYGMSFTFRICHRMREMEPGVRLRLLGGPAAPLSHSHALYARDRGGREADVVVLGILASSLPALYSTTHMTWNFEAPGAYTYPRHSLEAGRLTAANGPINSLDDLRGAIDDPARWRGFREHLRTHDAFFSPALFDQSILDRSAIVRCLRRAWAQRQKRAVIDQVHDAEGFRAESGVVELARALALDFARLVREDGATPVILLLNDQGYGDHLFRALEPALEEAGVAFVSTHEIAPADDPSNFIADGHFTDAMERAVAERLLATIRQGNR